MRNSFVFYKSWMDTIDTLPNEYKLEIYEAISCYGINEQLPKDMSTIVYAIMTNIKFGMDRSIARYERAKENGKKGGRPRKNSKIIDSKENTLDSKKTESATLDTKPTQKTPKNENLKKPKKNLNVYVNDNVNVYDNIIYISKQINKNIYNYLGIYTGARARARKDIERRPIIDYFSTFFDLYRGKFYEAGIEIVDCMLEALDMAYFSEKGLTYKGKRYKAEEFLTLLARIDTKEFCKIVNQLVFNETIESRAWYTLGCILKTNSAPTTREFYEVEQFKSDMLTIYKDKLKDNNETKSNKVDSNTQSES